MITFIFIISSVVIYFLILTSFRSQILSKEQAEKKINKLGTFIIGTVIIGIILINTGAFGSKEVETLTDIETAEEITFVMPVETPLTENQIFLQNNGFKIDADFTENQFKEFKKAIESGLFKKEDFCTVFQKGLKFQGAELKSYLRKYKSIPYFEDMLFMYGYKVCDPFSAKERESRKKPNYQSSDNVCLNSEDFIKQDLNYPRTADFSIFDCSVENNNDGSYTILRKVRAKNAFGVESEFIYKVSLGFTGGNDIDIKNWKLINMRSQEVK